MPLADVKTIYQRATWGGYAVGGFCAEHIDMVMAIVESAQEMNSPAIVFLYEEDINLAGPGILEAIVKEAASKVSVPIGIHLDHGSDMKNCLQAVMNSHSGVMIDGSHGSFEENVALTTQVVNVCKELGVIVEGEIGTIPRNFEKDGDYAGPKILTEAKDASEFVSRTGVDCLAISIGEESGMTRKDVRLDIPRLKEIRKAADAFLILHGGSGTPPDQIREIINHGIICIRFATEMRLAFFDALEKERQEYGHEYPISHKLLKPAREAAKKLIKKRMHHLGSVGQACTDGLCPPILNSEMRDAGPSSQAHTKSDIDSIVSIVEQELQRSLSYGGLD